MESLSRPVRSVKIPLTVAIPDYLRDHRYDGRIVLPAAEALQILARSLPGDLPPCDPRRQEGGVFVHLLPLDTNADAFSAFHEIAFFPDGRRQSRLTTLRTGRQTQWTRTIDHISVSFLPIGDKEDRKNLQCVSSPLFGGKEEGTEKGPERGSWGADPVGELRKADDDPSHHATLASIDTVGKEGPSCTFSCRRLYADLVPFGPAFHNVVSDVCLTHAGVSANVFGGDFREAVGPLGSPFPFDAAMHVACAWGQRYRNVVAFPVGFDRREILLPTSAGQTYLCRVFPLTEEGTVLRFNVWLFGEDHQPVEIILGLKMRDISGGRLKPPEWVRKGV
jgi:hypothetical protein